MSRNKDWIVLDERVRKAYEEEHNKHISYGRFRAMYPELVPSMNRKTPRAVRHAKNYNMPHRKGGPCQIQLTDEDDKKLVEEYKKGKSSAELAAEFGVTVQTVRMHLKKMDAYTEGRVAKAWTERDLETLKILYARGETYGYIAETLNRTISSVRNKIITCGIQKHKYKKRKPL